MYKVTRNLNNTDEDRNKCFGRCVVTGYANIDKKSFTGNAVSVSKEELLKVSKSNVIQALQVFDPP